MGKVDKGFSKQIDWLLATVAKNRQFIAGLYETQELTEVEYEEWLDALDSLEAAIINER